MQTELSKIVKNSKILFY